MPADKLPDFIAPDLTIDDGCHFITCTLLPDFCRKYKARSQLYYSRSLLNTYLTIHMEYYYWVAELTKLGAVHYHIVGKFKPMDDMDRKICFLDYLKNGPFKKVFGMCKINDALVVDKERTLAYMAKDLVKTYRHINLKLDRKLYKDIVLPYDYNIVRDDEMKKKLSDPKQLCALEAIIDRTPDIKENDNLLSHTTREFNVKPREQILIDEGKLQMEYLEREHNKPNIIDCYDNCFDDIHSYYAYDSFADPLDYGLIFGSWDSDEE